MKQILQIHIFGGQEKICIPSDQLVNLFMLEKILWGQFYGEREIKQI